MILNKPGVLCNGTVVESRGCPPSSQVGTARAVSPLLPQPLTGPVHIIQNPGQILPRLAIYLDGMASIRLDAGNSIFGVRILNSFDSVPDLPISSFELKINGGANGILKNFNDLCTSHIDRRRDLHAPTPARPPAASRRSRYACAKTPPDSPRGQGHAEAASSGRPVMK